MSHEIRNFGSIGGQPAIMYVTNDGHSKPDQRLIETLPPPAPEIIHAEREEYVVEDSHMRLQYPALRGVRGVTQPPSLLDIRPELRGCSEAYILGFTRKAHPGDSLEPTDPEFDREYARGLCDAAKLN